MVIVCHEADADSFTFSSTGTQVGRIATCLDTTISSSRYSESCASEVYFFNETTSEIYKCTAVWTWIIDINGKNIGTNTKSTACTKLAQPFSSASGYILFGENYDYLFSNSKRDNGEIVWVGENSKASVKVCIHAYLNYVNQQIDECVAPAFN